MPGVVFALHCLHCCKCWSAQCKSVSRLRALGKQSVWPVLCAPPHVACLPPAHPAPYPQPLPPRARHGQGSSAGTEGGHPGRARVHGARAAACCCCDASRMQHGCSPGAAKCCSLPGFRQPPPSPQHSSPAPAVPPLACPCRCACSTTPRRARPFGTCSLWRPSSEPRGSTAWPGNSRPSCGTGRSVMPAVFVMGSKRVTGSRRTLPRAPGLRAPHPLLYPWPPPNLRPPQGH